MVQLDISPFQVVTNPRYKQWLERLGENMNHTVLKEK